MMDKEFKQDWKYGDPEEVKKQQLKEFAALPFARKLEWLEQMQEIVENLKASKAKSDLESKVITQSQSQIKLLQT